MIGSLLFEIPWDWSSKNCSLYEVFALRPKAPLFGCCNHRYASTLGVQHRFSPPCGPSSGMHMDGWQKVIKLPTCIGSSPLLLSNMVQIHARHMARDDYEGSYHPSGSYHPQSPRGSQFKSLLVGIPRAFVGYGPLEP